MSGSATVDMNKAEWTAVVVVAVPHGCGCC